jgi:hypothetical protein
VDSRWRVARDRYPDGHGGLGWMLEYRYDPSQQGGQPTWEYEVPFADEEAEQIVHAILHVLPTERREAALRQAAKEADLLVLTRQQAAALLADEAGSPVPVADVMDAYLALAEQAGEDTSALRTELAAIRGEEVSADGR